jgi:hypothetical protein
VATSLPDSRPCFRLLVVAQVASGVTYLRRLIRAITVVRFSHIRMREHT